MKDETMHTIDRMMFRNMRRKLNKNKSLEYPRCLGHYGASYCHDGYEVTAGWAGEPGSYTWNCNFAKKCNKFKPVTRKYVVDFMSIPSEGENSSKAGWAAMAQMREAPMIDSIWEEVSRDKRKLVAEPSCGHKIDKKKYRIIRVMYCDKWGNRLWHDRKRTSGLYKPGDWFIEDGVEYKIIRASILDGMEVLNIEETGREVP